MSDDTEVSSVFTHGSSCIDAASLMEPRFGSNRDWFAESNHIAFDMKHNNLLGPFDLLDVFDLCIDTDMLESHDDLMNIVDEQTQDNCGLNDPDESELYGNDFRNLLNEWAELL